MIARGVFDRHARATHHGRSMKERSLPGRARNALRAVRWPRGGGFARLGGLLLICVGSGVAAAEGPTEPPKNRAVVPTRGLHLGAPAKKDLTNALEFIRELLPKQGVNTLILEFDYNFDFRSRPEFADSGALGKDEVQQIVLACEAKG